MSHVTYFAFYDTFGKESLTYLRALLVKWARSSSSGLYIVYISLLLDHLASIQNTYSSSSSCCNNALPSDSPRLLG